MNNKHSHKEEFYGITTLGEKGQAVIPIEARKSMKIKKGEKLFVLGMGHDMIVFSKLSNLKKFASHLTNKLKTIHKIIGTSNSK